MRISDWSSDVCSSDLRPDRGTPSAALRHRRAAPQGQERGLLAASGEVGAVALDVAGEVEGVLAHQGLGLLGFAALQRLDDGEMVHYRAVGAIVLADGRLPNRAHVEDRKSVV